MIASVPLLDSFVSPPFPVRRWSVDEYERLADSGFLTAEDKVELLEGWIVPKMTHNAPHDSAIQRLVDQLHPLLGSEWKVRVQSAITTADSVPEPDVAIVPGPVGRFDHQRPGAGEIEVVIEVAHASERIDRKKRGIYASAAVPSYWIVYLNRRIVEVHSQPHPETGKYKQVVTYGEGERLPLVVAGTKVGEIPVETILPSA